MAAAGVRLGPYEIVSRLGAGGMGEVWKARDTRLGRDVAIKISAERFSDRFEREAQVIASLNHSNICTLFDVGPEYLVMELVEGPTLADRLLLGPIPLDETLTIARQITDALDAAHERGIVHRDLKPGNIKVRPDGSVKVLDFGLAKTGATTTALTDDSPTELPLTRAGLILGTAAYMAPEQARGKTVDKRADIWSFGVVLCEMVTGGRVFKGENATDTLAAVLREEPDLTRAPRQLRKVLASCLEKDPRKRLRDIGDVWKLVDEPSSGDELTRRSSWRWISAVSTAAILLALAGWSAAYLRRNDSDTTVVRFTIPQPTSRGAGFDAVTVSPDGTRLVFGAGDNVDGLWLRALDSTAATLLQGTDGARGFSFWSADNRSLGFFAGEKLLRLDLAGGAATELADAPEPRGGAWSPDGTIVFAPIQTGPLSRVPAGGGAVSPITRLDTAAGEIAHRYPSFLPDGRRFLYAVAKMGAARVTVKVGSLDVLAEHRVLMDAGSSAVFAGGYLLYVDAGVLMARPFDPDRLAFTGEARAFSDSVRMSSGTNNLGGQPSFSASPGVLTFVSQDLEQFTWRDRAGKALGLLGDTGAFGRPELSPDGKRAAVVVSQNGNRDIFTYDLQRGLAYRFTSDPATEDDGMWSPDGEWIVFDSNRNGAFDLYRKRSDGSGGDELMYADTLAKYPTSFSPDGKYLLYWSSGDLKTGADIWLLPDPLAASGPSKPVPFLRTESRELFPQFSPDGKWIAYYSNETGRQEVYVAPFPGPGEKTRVSPSGGVVPRWRRDGSELFYIALDGTLMAAAIAVRNGVLDVTRVSPLFGVLPTASGYPYDASADGQRFLTVGAAPGVATGQLTVVRNWKAAFEK